MPRITIDTATAIVEAVNRQAFVLIAYRRVRAEGEAFIVAGLIIGDANRPRTAVLDLETGDLVDFRAIEGGCNPHAIATALEERQALELARNAVAADGLGR